MIKWFKSLFARPSIAQCKNRAKVITVDDVCRYSFCTPRKEVRARFADRGIDSISAWEWMNEPSVEYIDRLWILRSCFPSFQREISRVHKVQVSECGPAATWRWFGKSVKS